MKRIDPSDLRIHPFVDSGTGFTGWRADLKSNRGIPTPAVQGDLVFASAGFGTYDVFGLDARHGGLRWHRRTPDDGPTAGVIAGDYVAYNTESCTLEVLHRATGRSAWSAWLGDPMLAQPASDGVRVFAVYPHKGEHRIAAFTLASGERLWETPIGHDVITAPIVADDALYLSTFDGMVRRLRIEDGVQEWLEDRRATSAPWFAEGDFYVSERGPDEPQPNRRRRARPVPTEHSTRLDAISGKARHLYDEKRALYLRHEWGKQSKMMHRVLDASVGFGNAPAAAKLKMTQQLLGEHTVSRTWRYQGSRPIVVEGILYDTTGDRLEAKDPKSGELLWGWSAESADGERCLTPPAVTNGRVYVGTWSGELVSLGARDGSLRWRVPLGAPVHWQPAISGGHVFVGLQNGELVAFATGDAEDDGWSMWGGGPGHNGALKQPRSRRTGSVREASTRAE